MRRATEMLETKLPGFDRSEIIGADGKRIPLAARRQKQAAA